jgi:hypothetical protein
MWHDKWLFFLIQQLILKSYRIYRMCLKHHKRRSYLILLRKYFLEFCFLQYWYNTNLILFNQLQLTLIP